MEVIFGNTPVTRRIVTLTPLSFAFLGKMPILPGHMLVCPRRIVGTMAELTNDELLDLLALIALMKTALSKEFGATGFNTAWNEGGVAGQTVPHLHVHIVPRSIGDKGIAEYEPRQFLYRPGSRKCSPEKELEAIASKLSKAHDA